MIVYKLALFCFLLHLVIYGVSGLAYDDFIFSGLFGIIERFVDSYTKSIQCIIAFRLGNTDTDS